MPKVSVIILTYNAKKYIKKCLDSVLAQNYPNIEAIIIDNASSDGTVERINLWIKNNSINSVISYKLLVNSYNLGFAAGQNQGIRESKGEYILCLNQDAWLNRDFIKNAVDVLEKDEKIAAVQGKLIRFDFQNNKILDIIDTTGLVMLKNRRIINRDQGVPVGKLNQSEIEEIFGADGAAPIYRRKALEDTKLPINSKLEVEPLSSLSSLRGSTSKATKATTERFEYFDEDFFIYKEDVDLAWRLRLYGWKAVYIPQCVAYHGRGAGDSAASDYSDILKERRKISALAKYYSWKNQRLMQIKNEAIGLFLKHLFYILPKESASWIYILIFEEPMAIKSILKMFRQIIAAYKKRRIIMSKKKISDREMEKWFTPHT
ncbi:glycosyltransferase family 2 protein [Patescibacteria group bacterium]|nr:glycosyltransferase family 2 protein [Patescibacteria group bacterium]MBU3999678.1 glycosyltransferase family 2 protein [Patescibacteria group bacterium]MBU4057020.1 glycosyltransferase family 2 protein [Patescibacteria group bacterium]MBU4368399.1 glycosyltransferase family 2 protein [Patescibacteria group bacterium]